MGARRSINAKKNYDLFNGQERLPTKAYLLKPEKIFATSFVKLNNNQYRINIGYKSNYSGYVTETLRMNYDRIIKGSLSCDEVLSIRELVYNPKSSITTKLFSKTKIITFPVQNSMTVEIKCNKIFIEQIDIYVFQNDVLILDEDFKKN